MTPGIGGVAAYKAMTETGSALRNAVTAAKAGSGVLRLVLCSSRHRLDQQPFGDEWVSFYQYNHATLKPKLVVVTT